MLFSKRYRRRIALTVELQCNSLLEMLDELIDTNSKNADTAELRRTFEDANRNEFGRPIEYGKKFYRKHCKSISDQQTTFNDVEE